MTGNTHGFTIVEALVAFAILSVALVGLYAAAGTSMRALSHVSDAQNATLLAQSKLDELAAIPDALPPQSAGDFPQSDIGWKYEARDMPGLSPSARLRLQSVSLTLYWQRGLRTQSLSVETRHLGRVEP